MKKEIEICKGSSTGRHCKGSVGLNLHQTYIELVVMEGGSSRVESSSVSVRFCNLKTESTVEDSVRPAVLGTARVSEESLEALHRAYKALHCDKCNVVFTGSDVLYRQNQMCQGNISLQARHSRGPLVPDDMKLVIVCSALHKRCTHVIIVVMSMRIGLHGLHTTGFKWLSLVLMQKLLTQHDAITNNNRQDRACVGAWGYERGGKETVEGRNRKHSGDEVAFQTLNPVGHSIAPMQHIQTAQYDDAGRCLAEVCMVDDSMAPWLEYEAAALRLKATPVLLAVNSITKMAAAPPLVKAQSCTAHRRVDIYSPKCPLGSLCYSDTQRTAQKWLGNLSVNHSIPFREINKLQQSGDTIASMEVGYGVVIPQEMPTTQGNSPTFASTPFDTNVLPSGLRVPHTGTYTGSATRTPLHHCLSVTLACILFSASKYILITSLETNLLTRKLTTLLSVKSPSFVGTLQVFDMSPFCDPSHLNPIGRSGNDDQQLLSWPPRSPDLTQRPTVVLCGAILADEDGALDDTPETIWRLEKDGGHGGLKQNREHIMAGNNMAEMVDKIVAGNKMAVVDTAEPIPYPLALGLKAMNELSGSDIVKECQSVKGERSWSPAAGGYLIQPTGMAMSAVILMFGIAT
ncbi:hypothetical protein PR048_003924 [Dryococelus australis]|uniref:Uncharacterized protein n=1 Tax=Dryococelus australis TaxID=614101 RepID=A0ABQ9IPG8_9NEOP|nr:hypothetical protein PR048_003924 [Dryococelus australis]